MPTQRTLFGRPIRLSARRIPLLLVAVGLFALFTLFFTLPGSIPTGPSLSKTLPTKVSIPKFKNPLKFSSSILNPFAQAAHPPPIQKNSTDGESKWYSNWKWLSPFSSSVTLDENRAVLPPLRERPAIYCYYDTTIQREKVTKDAESSLLLTWRRAWWAKGFRPIILSAAEAMKNPLYDELQRLELDPLFKTDMMRWLAWETMGGGLLADYLLLPMGPHEDATLSFLRRGDYPHLTRWNGIDEALFAGPKTEVTAAVTSALRHPAKKGAKDFLDAVAPETFTVDKNFGALAFYSKVSLEKKYGKVSEELNSNRANGLKNLDKLINSHLHNTWQDLFPHGMAVLKPWPTHTTYMIGHGLDLAHWLVQCPDSPVPASCPPNLPKCSPCVSSHPMKITTPSRYRNTTGLYTIGTVPHPYTLASLNTLKDSLTVPWIRREMERDQWLFELTRELLGTGVSGPARIVSFKEAVAGQYATSHSIWFSAERDTVPHDVDWWFGFMIPVNGTDSGKSETPVPGPERRPKPEHDIDDGPLPKDEEFALEPELFNKARTFGHSKEPREVSIRNAIEAWNLADTEAWKFTRAFIRRARVERLQWEEEESKYAGGAGRDPDEKHGASWGRWN